MVLEPLGQVLSQPPFDILLPKPPPNHRAGMCWRFLQLFARSPCWALRDEHGLLCIHVGGPLLDMLPNIWDALYLLRSRVGAAGAGLGKSEKGILQVWPH